MFVVSQFILNKSGMCQNTQQTSTYSVALGLILYSSIYLYILFYNNQYLDIFNKFISYIVVIDLLLSAFYYFSMQKEAESILRIEEAEADEDDTVSDSEDAYTEDEENDVDDDESQQYIDNLIAQARVSDQQRMSAVMEDEVVDDPVVDEQNEVDVQMDAPVEETIEEVVEVKKRAVRKPKKIAVTEI